MGRRCSVCDHPDIGEINKQLLLGKRKVASIAKEFNLTVFALSRHKTNHLGSVIEEAREEMRQKAKEDYISNVEALNMIIQKLSETLDSANPTVTQILDAIRERAIQTGERLGSPEIIIK